MRSTIVCFILGMLVACSGSDGPTGPGGNNNPPPGGNGGGNQAPPTQRTVNLEAASFNPSDATVAVGGTVTWQDDSGVAHTITPRNHTQWTRVVTTGSGQALQVTFPTAGTFGYDCEFHSGMSGQIRVQ